MRHARLLGMAALGAALLGCDDDGGGTDAGPPTPTDAGEVRLCPSGEAVPAPEELMGPCCWRSDNAEQLDSPELRIAWLDIDEPMGSMLTSSVVDSLLNESLEEERFNWLFRVDASGGDGPVTITTGYGRRTDEGAYAFSMGAASSDPAEWCPIELTGTIRGESIETTPMEGAITVPVFDETGENLLVELELLNLSIEEATLSEERSCIGAASPRRLTYTPAARLVGYIEVDRARDQRIAVASIDTSVCGAIAGSLTDPAYCDQPIADWSFPPDSLCDAAGCRTNAEGTTDVCEPASTCNAWRFGAAFAAAGVDIENGLCM